MRSILVATFVASVFASAASAQDLKSVPAPLQQNTTAFFHANGRDVIMPCPPKVTIGSDGKAYYYAYACASGTQKIVATGVPLENAITGTPPVNMSGYSQAVDIVIHKDGTIELTGP
jgi:hypothetical protein